MKTVLYFEGEEFEMKPVRKEVSININGLVGIVRGALNPYIGLCADCSLEIAECDCTCHEEQEELLDRARMALDLLESALWDKSN